MSITGDMVAGTSHRTGVDKHSVKRILIEALECASEPNFAQRYAAIFLEENGLAVDTAPVGGDNKTALNDKMLDYWEVIQFLQDYL